MSVRRELVLRICPDEHSIRVEDINDGVTSFKEIALETFYDCVRHSIRHEGVRSGFLPQNCFHVGVSENGERDFCLWHPYLRADISYFGTEYPDFPLPRLVFGFRVSQEGKVLDCRLGVVEDKPPAEDSAMFVYPFSNVGGFHLCTGNNVLPVYKKTSALANLPGYLLQLPNNNDSFNPQNNKLHMPYRELLNHLKNKDPAYYYTDVLIPSRKTLKDFIA